MVYLQNRYSWRVYIAHRVLSQVASNHHGNYFLKPSLFFLFNYFFRGIAITFPIFTLIWNFIVKSCRSFLFWRNKSFKYIFAGTPKYKPLNGCDFSHLDF
ncbi:hypothetical protein FKM82_000304 [Ascaphus truei]